MATQAQCFYCFECLSASFDGKEAPSLARIDELWAQYEKSKTPSTRAESEAPSTTDDDVDELDVSLDEEDEEDDDDAIGGMLVQPQTKEAASNTLRLPSISRLKALSPSPSGSTPTPSSSVSANSSNSALTNSSLSSTSTNITTPGLSPLRRPTKSSVTESYPVFVTWNVLSRHGHKSLRGCIGTFESQPLPYGLKTYALTSAFDDTRFPPIPRSLVQSLGCSLTLLGEFTPCDDAMDWTLGKHGLRISFTHRGRRLGATYLPDVAVEQGWTKEECVESLMRKAGWEGGSSGVGVARRLLRAGGATGRADSTEKKPWDEVTDFKAIRYEGLQSTATYAEWMAWRRWAEGLGQDGLQPL